MKIDKNFVLREIAGEYIIIPTGRTALEFNGLITVNEVGMELWKMLQEDVTFDDLLNGILEEYDVDENAAREDIQEFLDRLVKGGILTEDEKSEK
nr:PqqD family protein [uncultured Blautia sp.]